MAAAKKYRAIKYGGDDQYSWAVFKAIDIKGLRSPISEYTKVRPLVSGCIRSEAQHYIKQFEEVDKKRKLDNNTSI